MQIIEVTGLAVRTVVVRLRRRGSRLRFVLFPMVHVGTAEYYAEIRDRVSRCDLAVVEGVGVSAATKLLTAPQRIPSFFRRTGLVPEDLELSTLGIPLVRPDMTGEEFDRGWQRMPLAQRLVVLAAMPLAVGYRSIFGTRAGVAAHLALDDDSHYLADRESAGLPDLEKLIADDRDLLLIRALMDLHEQRSGEDIDVAVVYGAGHIAAVAHAISGLYGYVAGEGEFVTVFDL